MTDTDIKSRDTLTRGRWWALAVGVIGLALCGIAGASDRTTLLRAYLAGWLFVWGMALGSLALVMVHHLTGGAWGIFVRRILEAQMRTLPLVALLFIPIALGAHYLYPWAEQSESAQGLNRFYGNYFARDFVVARWIAYFVLWALVAWLLSWWSRRQDRSPDVWPAGYSQSLSGPGLVLYGISLHFAAIDWMMSLQSSFTSTIFGPIVAASQLLSALALTIIILACLVGDSSLPALSSKVLNDLGNLLLTLVVVWSYLVWCQAMLIWMADLPRDNIWWLARWNGPWRWTSIMLAVFQFAVPFFLLLLRAVKQNIRRLAAVAGLVLLMQVLFVVYQIGPALGGQRLAAHWMEFVMPLALGGIWLAFFLWLLSRRPLVLLHDRNWPHALHLRDLDEEEATREEALAHG